MSYIEGNKAAWEEAFDHRHPGWGERNHERLLAEYLPFFNEDMSGALQGIDFKGKAVAQFCCNNGRELLSLMRLGAARGVGFDIAENIIAQARDTAAKAGITNCVFEGCDILSMPGGYGDSFDFAFFTIGAIAWFKELTPLFAKVSQCLKPGGVLMINDFHPFMGMLAMPGEPGFDPEKPTKITYSYYKKEPWIENNGMGYMSVEYDSKVFTSFSHTMSDIINALSANGIKTVKLNEYDYDIGLSNVYDGRGLPLSYILIAEKCRDGASGG